jgi:hypothetical protein
MFSFPKEVGISGDKNIVPMAVRSLSDSKTLKNQCHLLSMPIRFLLEIFAVFIAHFESQKNVSGSPKEELEETLLREHLAEASSLLTTHGGTVVHSSARFCRHIFITARTL